MLHNYSPDGADPSSSGDHRAHSLGYCHHGIHRPLPPKSPSPVLNDPPAGAQTSRRSPPAVEYPDYGYLTRARELRRQQAEEQRRAANQQQWAHYWQTQEERGLAKALEDSFITGTAHRLFLKNKEREEDRVRRAQEAFLREQQRRDADWAREQLYIDQYHQHEKEKMERRERRKERKAQQQQQQQQQQRVSFVTPVSCPTTSAPVPVITSPTSTHASLTSRGDSTEEISNPENKQLQRLERRFQLRRPSPENDNPSTGRELYQNPFMEPALWGYYSSPPPASPTGTTSHTISLSTLPPRSPVSSTSSYLQHHSDKEKEVKEQQNDKQRAQERVHDWFGAREGGRYRSRSHFKKETRRSRSRSRSGKLGDGYRETVWEREEREINVAADRWGFDDGDGGKTRRGRPRGRWADNGGNAGGRGEWEVYRDY
ncbi:hypothetical protein QC764_507670 [Podospora pseudoanserina]|uniref:Uncharacterized protein n=1 Tax=Podospora pseudoanserina TaxID=2609844 RepID=A0ABR0I6F1_9PEZI|nr:hypothetical protein QC764_507670 [Podospora pseudoanserina]